MRVYIADFEKQIQHRRDVMKGIYLQRMEENLPNSPLHPREMCPRRKSITMRV